jgi:hypothetical protein
MVIAVVRNGQLEALRIVEEEPALRIYVAFESWSLWRCECYASRIGGGTAVRKPNELCRKEGNA